MLDSTPLTGRELSDVVGKLGSRIRALKAVFSKAINLQNILGFNHFEVSFKII